MRVVLRRSRLVIMRSTDRPTSPRVLRVRFAHAHRRQRGLVVGEAERSSRREGPRLTSRFQLAPYLRQTCSLPKTNRTRGRSSRSECIRRDAPSADDQQTVAVIQSVSLALKTVARRDGVSHRLWGDVAEIPKRLVGPAAWHHGAAYALTLTGRSAWIAYFRRV
jgi:hypothetical protein